MGERRTLVEGSDGDSAQQVWKKKARRKRREYVEAEPEAGADRWHRRQVETIARCGATGLGAGRGG